MDKYIKELVEKFHKQQELLTKNQFEACLIEAINSGDFMRYCTPIESKFNSDIETTSLGGNADYTVSSSQAMTYIPFRDKNRLELEISNLIEFIEEYDMKDALNDWNDCN